MKGENTKACNECGEVFRGEVEIVDERIKEEVTILTLNVECTKCFAIYQAEVKTPELPEWDLAN